MLAIRLQRVGRTGYPVYRVAVMEAQRHPLTGRVVAYVGTYNPHTKEHKLDKELIEKYLNNGAQPTPRVVKLLSEDKIKLPKWVEKHGGKKKSKIRFEDKLRKNRPAEPVKSEPVPAAPVSDESGAGPAVDSSSEATEEVAETDAKEEPSAEATEEVVEAEPKEEVATEEVEVKEEESVEEKPAE